MVVGVGVAGQEVAVVCTMSVSDLWNVFGTTIFWTCTSVHGICCGAARYVIRKHVRVCTQGKKSSARSTPLEVSLQ